MKSIPLLFLLIISVFCLPGCDNGKLNIFSTSQDLALGKRFTDEILADPGQYPVLKEEDYPEAYEHLKKITDAILGSSHLAHRDDFAWEVRIIENDSIMNAFCTPGGYIYVYTGIIKFLDSEDQLAGVLGHEIAHADLRHSTSQLTKTYGLNLAIRIFLGDHSALGGIAGNLVGLNFSRHDETEADLQSVIYLSDTKYDPRGVAYFFQKMEEKGESLGPLVFLSTHPNPENRVEKIYAEWKRLGSPEGKTFKNDYKDFKESLP